MSCAIVPSYSFPPPQHGLSEVTVEENAEIKIIKVVSCTQKYFQC